MHDSAFSVFGLQPRLAIDVATLEKAHRVLSTELHPDAPNPSGDRVVRAERLAHVNAAYKQLKDPVGRAEALFTAHGVAFGDGVEPAPAGDLLMSVLEAREELSDARRAKDVATCARMLAESRTALQRAAESVQSAMTANDTQLALRFLGVLRYQARLAKDAQDSVSLLEDE